MRDDWTRARLGEVVDLLAGYAFKSEFYSEEAVGPRLCLGANVAPGAPDWTKVRYWPTRMCHGVERYHLADGDIVLAMDRPWIPGGLKVFRFAKADGPALLVQRVARLRGTSLLDTRFLYAVLRHSAFVEYILGVQTGTTVPHISSAQILSYQIDLPPMPEQRRIAAVLGALDDKIELNRNLNRTLEEMAQALFKSWFIDFDGHDDLTDSEIGPVPSGWDVRPLGDLISLEKGLSYKGDYLTDHGVPMVNLKCVLPNGGFRRDGVKPYSGEFKPRHQVNAGDIVIANTDLTQARDILGCPAFVPGYYRRSTVITSHHTFAVRLRSSAIGTQFVYGALLSERARDRCRGFATGTTVLAVPADAILGLEVALPPSDIGREYEEAAGTLRARIEANHEECETLAALRDTLIPKLLSGELRVPEAESAVSEVT
jgi:type I restriction enzyme S subunit